MMLSILIPTLNRSSALLKNLALLDQFIQKEEMHDEIEILISDNGSSVDEKEVIREGVSKLSSNIICYYQEKNIGFEKNMIFLLKKSKGLYAMTLGDDDYLEFELFDTIIKYIRTTEYKVIVCNFYLVDENGEKISPTRDLIQEDRVYSKGDLRLASRGHQMSCLVFETKDLYDTYKKRCRSNLYPQVFFVGFNLSRGEGVHITRFPYQCTSLKKKNFEYSFDNLLGEICIAYDCLLFESEDERKNQLKYFINSERDRFIGRSTFFRPISFIHLVRKEYCISKDFKNMIIHYYLIESLKLPFVFMFQRIFRGKR